MSRQGLGWLVEVTDRFGGKGQRRVRRYHVAVPNKGEAIAAVRRRLADVAGAAVEAVTPLSRHAVYDLLRLKRGDIQEAPNLEEKEHIDELLDEALEETFPCSDPIATGTFTSTEQSMHPVDRKARKRHPKGAG
jgi:hypothetical protein